MRPITLRRVFLVALVVLSGFAVIFPTAAGPAADYGKAWEAGVADVEREDMRQWYAQTYNREFRIVKQVSEGEIDIVEYVQTWKWIDDDSEAASRYRAYFMVVDGKIVGDRAVLATGVDQALAGQAADIATTALGLSQGLVEANPIGATPGGLAALVVAKIAAPTIADNLDLGSCIDLRMGLSQMGYGAAAWNLGMLVLGPGAAFAGLVLTYVLSEDRDAAIAACLEAKLI